MNTKICSVPSCGKPKFSYGFCTAHANNFKRRGDPLKEPERKIGKFEHCTYADCKESHYGKGLCRIHYRRKFEKEIDMEKSPCVVCGNEDTRRVGTRFCSDACAQTWHRSEGSRTRGARLLRSGPCAVCPEPVHAGVYCDKHYQRFKKYGDPHANPAPIAMEYCTACKKPRGKVDVKRQGSRELCGACYSNEYYYLNHKREKSRRNSRRSYQRRQTPPWADLDAIRAFYDACPPGQEVDHFYPLRGRHVSGLHVESNLQYLPMRANRRKGNSVPDENSAGSPA